MEEQRMREIAASTAAAYPCRRILLFGSRARGDFHEGSDLNLCIVVDAVPTAAGGGQGDSPPAPASPAETSPPATPPSAGWLERSREVKRRVELPEVELDPHVYTEEELKALRAREDPYVLQMLAEGRVLYEQQ
jgi:predicted nucleotidyltransferase